jgi:hypothetical protein
MWPEQATATRNQALKRLRHLRWKTRLEWFAPGGQLPGNQNFVRRTDLDYVRRRFESKLIPMKAGHGHWRCCFERAGLSLVVGNAPDGVHL